MPRLLVWVALSILYAITPLSAEEHRQCTIDTTHAPNMGSMGMAPSFSSNHPGHSVGFPVVLDLVIGSGQLQEEGTGLIDFVFTNVGKKAIKLPATVESRILEMRTPHTQALMLYLSAPGGFGPVDLTTSADIYGNDRNPQTFCFLAPGHAMRVHASTRFRLTPGRHTLTAHAELLKLAGGTAELMGTADSRKV